MARVSSAPIRLGVMGLALLARAGDASGCLCLGDGKPCIQTSETPVVFVGRVTSVDEKTDLVGTPERQERVRMALKAHFAVEEAFRGLAAASVDVDTGGGGGDCGYSFKSGERYLVYAPLTRSVEIVPPVCGDRHEFWIEIDGRIGGRVFDEAGRLVDDTRVSLVSAESDLPLTEAPPVYHPSALDRKAAAVLTLREAERLTDVDVRVTAPPRPPTTSR